MLGRMADEQGVSAYVVGGCVRDWCLGIPKSTDLDVVIVGDGIAFARIVVRRLKGRLQTHAQFGTATLFLSSIRSLKRTRGKRLAPAHPMRIDIATCRRERYDKPAAYPKVTPGSLTDDLFRRDFTINAMAMAITASRFGELIDPFGGLNDLQARRLRVLHPNSFLDDPSRILRGARFLERFHFRLESNTAKQLRRTLARGMLGHLNRGRLHKEFQRMLQEPNPLAPLARVVQWLRG